MCKHVLLCAYAVVGIRTHSPRTVSQDWPEARALANSSTPGEERTSQRAHPAPSCCFHYYFPSKGGQTPRGSSGRGQDMDKMSLQHGAVSESQAFHTHMRTCWEYVKGPQSQLKGISSAPAAAI